MPLFHPPLGRINEKEVLRYAGMRQTATLPADLVAFALGEAVVYARPAGVWEFYDYEPPALKTAAGDYVPDSQKLCRHLYGAARVAIMAVSVGGAIEERIGELFAAGEYTKALLLDAAADSAVEQAADSVCAFIASAGKPWGLCAGRRFSPGYGDWPLKEQPRLLQLSGADRINVGMTGSFMLTPQKSITAALGLGPKKESESMDTGCAACAKADCQLRRREN